jgi:ABC-type branched-subunit amino acid transport system ATPase component
MTSVMEIVDISKTLGDYRVLNGVRANIPLGKITAFVGPNGAGKTTLFNVLSGQMPADSGEVLFEGRNILGLPAHSIARLGVSRLFQDVRVFPGLTSTENVVAALVRPDERLLLRAFTMSRSGGRGTALRQLSAYWLEQVGLSDQRATLARELSFGQQKLLALARLLARDNRLLLLDEPTAGLSQAMIAKVTDLLRRLIDEQQISIALIEHNMGVVSDIVDWIHFLHEGRVAFSGQRSHVLNHPHFREIYIGL